MKVLIVGGTGVLSAAVAVEAIRRGISVTMINRGTRPIPAGAKLIKADKDDFQSIGLALRDTYYDAAIDFLCLTDRQTEKSVRFYSCYAKQYLYISSCAVYNTALLAGKIGNEESPKQLDIWDYSIGKWESEKLLISLFESLDSYYTIVRPCVTYDNTRIPYGIAPTYGYHWTLCARVLAGKPLIKWNGGVNRCNIMRVEDFAVGVVGLIGNPQAYNEAYNICGDETPSWNEILDAIGEVLKKKVQTVDISSEFYANEMPDYRGDILGGRSIDSINSNDKIKKIVPDFGQRINYKEGIARTIEAYKAQNYQKGIDWTFDACTDRIINKWNKSNNISYRKLFFVDYLGDANLKGRYLYWIEYNKKNGLVKAWIMLGRYARKTFVKITRIFIKK